MSLITAITMGVASLAGGKMSADAATDAGDAMADATKYAADLQNKQYETTRGDLAPYRDVGPGALNYLTGLVTPRASDADLAKWGRQVGNVKGKIQDTNALIKKRTDRLKRLGQDASYSETVTTTAGGEPVESTKSKIPFGNDTIGGAFAGLGADAVDNLAGNTPVQTTTTTREYTDPRLQKLYDRRENLQERRSALKENISAGENGMQLRDPYALDQDSLYAISQGDNPYAYDRIYRNTPQRETAAYGDTPYAFTGDGIDTSGNYEFTGANYLDPSAYEASPEYQYLLDRAQDATVADAAARGTRYSGAVAEALQQNAVGLASQDRNAWFGRQVARAENDRSNFATGLAGTNARVANDATARGNDRANAALGMQGYTAYNALRDSDQAWNYSLMMDNYSRGVQDRSWNYGAGLDSYGRAMGERRDTINDMFALTGIGQSAATQTGNFGANAATNAGNLAVQGGQAQSQAIQGASNAWSNALNNTAATYGAYKAGYFNPSYGQPSDGMSNSNYYLY